MTRKILFGLLLLVSLHGLARAEEKIFLSLLDTSRSQWLSASLPDANGSFPGVFNEAGLQDLTLSDEELKLIRGRALTSPSPDISAPRNSSKIILWDEASANNPCVNVSTGHNNAAVNILRRASN